MFTLYKYVTIIFVQVTLGMFGHEERVVYEPLTPGAIEVRKYLLADLGEL